MEEENKKLQQKMKHIESQVTIAIKQSQPPRTTSKLNTKSIPYDEKTGEHIPPWKLSPRPILNSKLRYSSPVTGVVSSAHGIFFSQSQDESGASDYSEDSPYHMYKLKSNKNVNISDVDSGEDNFDRIQMYSKDTTTPKRSYENNTASLSKTCLLM